MADDYERKHMPGVGEVLLRHKVTSPTWLVASMTALPLALGAFAAIGLIVGGQVLAGLGVLGGAALFAAFFTLLNVTFATARLAVSEGEVHLQLGFAGPKIPIAEIARVTIAPSGSNRIGMGVRSDLRGTTTYTLWGNNERAVHIERTDGSKLVLVVKEADAIVSAIETARARHGAQLRVGVDETPAAASESEEEAEAEQSERERAL